jgi:Mrp family chromosome partitioning ATPase
VLSVSDPVIISSVVETGILVIRAGRTPRQSVRMAAAKLQHAGAASFGVVLNDLDAASHGAAYYRYHYYGRYGETETGQPGADRRARGTGA